MSLISVIIPVYNAELYLRRCLDSLLAQSLREWEAVCVDDGSKDASASIMEEYESADPRFSVIRQVNAGASAARNVGLRKAKGDYIFFLDSDDELEPNCLETLWKEVELHPNVEMVVGANDTIDDNGTSRRVIYGKSCYVESNEWVRIQFFKDEKAFSVVPWNKLIRKEFLIENSLFFKEGIIHEDEHWSFFLYKKLSNISVLDEVTYLHFVTPTSVMSTKTDEKTAETILLILRDLVRCFDAPCRSLQVFKYLEYYRNFVPKDNSRELYFSFFKELRKIGQYRIAFLWLINWFHNYKHFQLYNKIIPEAYKQEVNKAVICCKIL